MKNKKGVPRKATMALKSLNIIKNTPKAPITDVSGDKHKSTDQIKQKKPEMGGNFSFFREKVKNGGSSDDLNWILDLRNSKRMPKPEK